MGTARDVPVWAVVMVPVLLAGPVLLALPPILPVAHPLHLAPLLLVSVLSALVLPGPALILAGFAVALVLLGKGVLPGHVRDSHWMLVVVRDRGEDGRVRFLWGCVMGGN